MALVVAILLSPLFFFLLSPDQALFHVSGQKILQGAIHYRDIVDVKPPLIYHIYAFAILVFGSGEASSRILDFILQAITCGMLAMIVRRASGDDTWAAVAACTYAIIYVSLSSGSTGLAESYTGIVALPVIWLLVYRRTRHGLLLVGVLCGLLFVLKFTLGIMLAAALAAEVLVFRSDWRTLLRSSAMMTAGFVAVMALFALYIVGLGALPGFLEMNQFLSSYIQLSGPSPSDWISHTIVALPTYLGEGYTLAYLFATVAGIVLSLQMARDTPGADLRDATGADDRDAPSADDRDATAPHDPAIARVANSVAGTQQLLRLCTIAFILMFGSVLVETRYGGGSFSRLLPFGAVLSTYAALRFSRHMQQSRPWDAYTRVMLTLFVAAALFLSPALRYLRHAAGSVITAVRGDAGYDAYFNRSSGWYTRAELNEIGDYIRQNRGPYERIFVASSVAALVYIRASEIPEFKIFHSAFIAQSVAPNVWRDTTSKYLLATRPRFVVIHRSDSLSSVTGLSTSTEAQFRWLAGVDSLLRADYRHVFSTPRFDLYDHGVALTPLNRAKQ